MTRTTIWYGIACYFVGALVGGATAHGWLPGWWTFGASALVGLPVGWIGAWIHDQRNSARDEAMWNAGADARQRMLEAREQIRKINEMAKQQDHA